MGIDNFFIVGGGACVATPNFVATRTYWIATVAVVFDEKVACPFWQK